MYIRTIPDSDDVALCRLFSRLGDCRWEGGRTQSASRIVDDKVMECSSDRDHALCTRVLQRGRYESAVPGSTDIYVSVEGAGLIGSDTGGEMRGNNQNKRGR